MPRKRPNPPAARRVHGGCGEDKGGSGDGFDERQILKSNQRDFLHLHNTPIVACISVPVSIQVDNCLTRTGVASSPACEATKLSARVSLQNRPSSCHCGEKSPHSSACRRQGCTARDLILWAGIPFSRRICCRTGSRARQTAPSRTSRLGLTTLHFAATSTL